MFVMRSAGGTAPGGRAAPGEEGRRPAAGPRAHQGAHEGREGGPRLRARLPRRAARVPAGRVAELKGSIGEGPNHSNFSDQSSVTILAKFRNFRQKIKKFRILSTR